MIYSMSIRHLVAAILGLAAALSLSSCNSLLHNQGLHPDYTGPTYDVPGRKVLIVTTSHAVLNKPGETTGDPTGVFASEMTIPYYDFLDAGMEVHVASVQGGPIPIDPQSFKPAVQAPEDERYLADPIFRAKVANSIPVAEVDFKDYDVVFFSGGWGAAYDLHQSQVIAQKVSDAYYESDVIFGSVCHGALGFTSAQDKNGEPLVKGRDMTGVSQAQLDQLHIAFTPKHPEEELRAAGANYQCSTGRRDFFETLTLVDQEQRFVTGQNQNSSHETAHQIMRLLAAQ